MPAGVGPGLRTGGVSDEACTQGDTKTVRILLQCDADAAIRDN